MIVVWSREAVLERLEILEFISSNNQRAAEAIDSRFDRAVERLRLYPELGRIGLVPGTRELFPLSELPPRV